MNQSLPQLSRALNFRNQFNKITWTSSNPYNKRWQFKFKHAYYSYPRDINQEHTYVKKPEDSWNAVPLGWAWFQDIYHRILPGFSSAWERRSRLYDKLNVYALPGFSLFFYQFFELGLPFKVLTLLPWFVIYTRARDRTGDPDFKETYLRDMLYKNDKITEYFNEETLHILDYDCEYDKGFPDPEKFPEFNNRVFRFFNNDTSMTTGFFKIGDVETGAVMNLRFKTMPIAGKYRYQVGEPFYFYDLRADITVNGILKEVVLVDENESLKKIRPFLFLI